MKGDIKLALLVSNSTKKYIPIIDELKWKSNKIHRNGHRRESIICGMWFMVSGRFWFRAARLERKPCHIFRISLGILNCVICRASVEKKKGHNEQNSSR